MPKGRERECDRGSKLDGNLRAASCKRCARCNKAIGIIAALRSKSLGAARVDHLCRCLAAHLQGRVISKSLSRDISGVRRV
jgi:hypothetical protein